MPSQQIGETGYAPGWFLQMVGGDFREAQQVGFAAGQRLLAAVQVFLRLIELAELAAAQVFLRLFELADIADCDVQQLLIRIVLS